MSLTVLSVASELFPLVKTGGLADVTGGLPQALQAYDIDIRSLVPGYPGVMSKLTSARTLVTYDALFGGRAALLEATSSHAPGLSLLVLDAPHLYDRLGGPYQTPEQTDWPDNAQRFAALSWVAHEIGIGALKDWRPQAIHAHDWQTGLAPAYLHFAKGPRPGTVLTIHNLAFQGQFPSQLLTELRLPAAAWSHLGVEHYGQIGFLKAGLHYSDKLTTVSPAYAREIQTPAGGMGLDGLLRIRSADLTGIVNGIDDKSWNPADDPHLIAAFDGATLNLKAQNKSEARRRFGLVDDNSPLICMVTRLSWQKGIDAVIQAMPQLMALGGQLAVLGDGEAGLKAGIETAARQYSGRVSAIFGYDEGLAHLLQGGADAILIPSRFEPCGLTQLYGQRYGALPIVARTGGLADTVIDANEAALADGVATGFQFAPLTVETLADVWNRVITLYRDEAAWRQVQRRAMSRELGWSKPAAHYAKLYRAAAEARSADAASAARS